MNYGAHLHAAISDRGIVPLIGVYDALSATIAARRFDGLFVSGFSFAASYYGLPDIGFIAWSDIVSYTQRVRTLLPNHHIVVDIDDGYCDQEVACHVALQLERCGASGVVLEDQLRPRMCGHLDGKAIMDLTPYLEKLTRVLETRRNLFVVARTDATDGQEALHRARAFAEVGADAILVEAVRDLDLIRELRSLTRKPVVFNQIAGGKSPPASLSQLREAGVSLVNYSTPCLFAAHAAMDAEMRHLSEHDGLLRADPAGQGVDVRSCTDFLNQNLDMRRGGHD